MIAIELKVDAERALASLHGFSNRINPMIQRALRRGAEVVVKQAQLNLTNNRSVAFGALRASIGYRVGSGGAGGGGEPQGQARIGPGVGRKATSAASGDPTSYGFFVEHGRKAGRMPPREALDLWIRRKVGRDPGERLSGGRTLRDAILSGIAKRGTVAKPFLVPALEQSRPAVEAAFRAELQRSIEEAMRQ